MSLLDIILIIAIVLLFIWVVSLSAELQKLKANNNPDQNKLKTIFNKVNDLERWMQYYHPSVAKESEKTKMEYKRNKDAKEEQIRAWCKNKGFDKERTEKEVKKYLAEWDKAQKTD